RGRCIAGSGCAGSVSGPWPTAANCPASPSQAGSRPHARQHNRPGAHPGNDRNAAGPQGNHGEEGHQAMTMTDPIADMLTRLRNANSAYHDTVSMPSSTIKVHIAEILQQQGYIAGWRVEDAEVGKNLVISLKYGPTR